MSHRTSRRAAHATALATVSRISFTLAGLALGAAPLAGCIDQSPAGEPGDPQAVPEGQGDGMADGAAPGGDDMSFADAAWDDVAWDDASPDDMGSADGGEWGDAVADAMADAIVDDPEPDPEPAADAGADAMVWSETMQCPSPAEDPDGWAACCEARGWFGSGDPNCAAWGPPMPPRMLA